MTNLSLSLLPHIGCLQYIAAHLSHISDMAGQNFVDSALPIHALQLSNTILDLLFKYSVSSIYNHLMPLQQGIFNANMPITYSNISISTFVYTILLQACHNVPSIISEHEYADMANHISTWYRDLYLIFTENVIYPTTDVHVSNLVKGLTVAVLLGSVAYVLGMNTYHGIEPMPYVMPA